MTIKEITPALDFIGAKACVAVPVIELVEDQVKRQAYVIMTGRDKFLLDKSHLLEKGFYSFRNPSPPERWSRESIENYLSGEEISDFRPLFEAITNQYSHYIDFGDSRIAKYMACWVIGTYFHRLFTSYPYIHLNGTMESGKSKTLMITAQLAFNGQLTVNSTASFVIRTIHDNHSTCCIDEIENLQRAKDDNSLAVVGMYNAGYKRGSFVGKAEQIGRNSNWEPKQYEAYSPKIFASINGLEPSLASRTVPIEMVRSTNGAVKNREVSNQDPTLTLIRDQLYPVMLEQFLVVRAIYSGIQDEEIVGREWELWKPILAIAKAIDSDLALYGELRQLALESGANKKETVLESMVTPKILDALETLLLSETNYEATYSGPQIINQLIEADRDSFGWLANYDKANHWIGKELRKAGAFKGRAGQAKIDGVNTRVYQLNLRIIQERLTAFR